MDATNRKIIEVARAQFEAEGKVTYTYLRGQIGLGYRAMKSRVNRMRGRGVFPWPLTPAPWVDGPPVATFVAPRPEPERADDAIRREVLARAMEGMIDGRGEIDDPREHGPLSPPRSLPRSRASEDLRGECRKFYREWRAVVRRQRWGSNRKGAAA
jgi:hypothetical protein